MFKSNGVRSLVELHEIELNRFYETWQRFRDAAIPVPESRDPNYASVEHLLGHVLRASRNYLTWMGDCVQRPVTDVDLDNDVVSVAGKGQAFLEHVLAGWRRHLVALEDEELTSPRRLSRWGEDYSVEQMLEHAVVHPMRHRIQLERLMRSAAISPRTSSTPLTEDPAGSRAASRTQGGPEGAPTP